jgi:hypothetical protein
MGRLHSEKSNEVCIFLYNLIKEVATCISQIIVHVRPWKPEHW